MQEIHLNVTKAKLLLGETFFIIIFTYLNYLDVQVQNGKRVLTWQPSSIHFRHVTSLLRLDGHSGPVYLLQVSKNDDEKRCFLK